VASTDKNDENSLVIQSDTQVADIYFTEFMRLFDHFSQRGKYKDFSDQKFSGTRVELGAKLSQMSHGCTCTLIHRLIFTLRGCSSVEHIRDICGEGYMCLL
jgi:hypothetical protein